MNSGIGESVLRPAVARAVLSSLLGAALAGCMTEPARSPALVRTESAIASEDSAAQSSTTDAGAQQDTARADESQEGAPPQADAPLDPWTAPSTRDAGFRRWVQGSLATRYRGRTNGDDSDHSLEALLAVDVADPANPWISGHLQTRVELDMEGKDDGEAFGDLSDTYDSSVIAHLYLAYADIALGERPEDSPGTLRVGRQSDPYLPEVLRLDGASYLTRPFGEKEVSLGAYAGIPVHLYESSHEGDRAFGTFAEGRPWRDGRVRFDWMHLEDELVLGDERDDLVALGWWQDLPKHWRLEGEYSHLEGDPRDLRLRAFWDDLDSETILRIGYYQLLETQTSHVTELDPFTEALQEYFPFRQTTLNVSQAFGARTVVDAGFDMRRVTDSDDVGEFNRDWERYYATGTLSDVGAEGLALSLTVDRWDDDDRDTSSVGADASWDADRLQASAGTYWSLYKYEFLELDEREDVRTYYARTSYDVNSRLELEALYEFEDDDLDTYHTLRLGALWRF